MPKYSASGKRHPANRRREISGNSTREHTKKSWNYELQTQTTPDHLDSYPMVRYRELPSSSGISFIRTCRAMDTWTIGQLHLHNRKNHLLNPKIMYTVILHNMLKTGDEVTYTWPECFSSLEAAVRFGMRAYRRFYELIDFRTEKIEERGSWAETLW